uniref:Uncharacterized protein n=1 Tax=Calcidiscus leptoporus TaxID=127549 RepID=A0A6U5NVK0_9EUKA|mmetsp:Transcript_8880/g.20738  ORF Transcript_8880/g.20738 Transcript_8880/m.20738 type:complete len:354 (+) Transcript_8880:160-1221(+)
MITPLHLRVLESDWSFAQRHGPSTTMAVMMEHATHRQRHVDRILALLNAEGSFAPSSHDPLVHVTAEGTLPTSVFLPHALEGAAQDFSAADLCAWASVCSAWAGWVRRLLHDPTALRWLWSRLLLSHIEQVDLGYLRHPELSPRMCFRTLLLEARARAADVPLPKVYASDVVGGIADLWAYFANFCDEGACRFHGFDADLPFRPYLGPQGAYASPGACEASEMRELLVGMRSLVDSYVRWVREEHNVERNLTLSVVLIPFLEENLSQTMRFLEIDAHDGSPHESEEDLRRALTEEKAAKLAAALRDFACLFPSKADVERAAEGQPIHTGRLEAVLQPDQDENGSFRFTFIPFT